MLDLLKFCPSFLRLKNSNRVLKAENKNLFNQLRPFFIIRGFESCFLQLLTRPILEVALN